MVDAARRRVASAMLLLSAMLFTPLPMLRRYAIAGS